MLDAIKEPISSRELSCSKLAPITNTSSTYIFNAQQHWGWHLWDGDPQGYNLSFLASWMNCRSCTQRTITSSLYSGRSNKSTIAPASLYRKSPCICYIIAMISYCNTWVKLHHSLLGLITSYRLLRKDRWSWIKQDARLDWIKRVYENMDDDMKSKTRWRNVRLGRGVWFDHRSNCKRNLGWSIETAGIYWALIYGTLKSQRFVTPQNRIKQTRKRS